MFVFFQPTAGGPGFDYLLQYDHIVGLAYSFDVAPIVQVLFERLSYQDDCSMAFRASSDIKEAESLRTLAAVLDTELDKAEAMWRVREIKYYRGSFTVRKRKGFWGIMDTQKGWVYLIFRRFGVEDL